VQLNYYFLRKLSAALNQKLTGYEIATCFSQEKDEVVFGFTNGSQDFFIKAILTNTFAALAFPEEFHRKRQNSVDLFKETVGKTVEKVVQHENERSFYLQLSDGYTLLFKLFGNRSNIVLYNDNVPVSRFHKKLSDDFALDPQKMDRKLDLDNFELPLSLKELKQLWPTLGDLPIAWLETQNFNNLTAKEQENLLEDLKQKLEEPEYLLTKFEGKLRLSLLPLGEILTTYQNPIEAANSFSIKFLSSRFFDTNFNAAKQYLEKQKNGAEQVLEQTEIKLKTLQTETAYAQTADLIMANLHAIPPRAATFEVFDFYRNEPRVIKLKSTETPQKTAERLYKKGKNQQIELKLLEEKALRKTEEIFLLEEKLAKLNAISDSKTLKQFLKENDLFSKETKTQIESPFREFNTEGFKILVGKSAANNDVLTQKMAHKDDLWLHAKDVSGSHVIIKFQAGKTIPTTVLKKAAQLAAYYSKRKTDSLCPVIYTPKKFVRKPKGAAPGSVIVDRENVILVTPQNPFERSF
jgi:predicted ribosome quality control (RQC) complex YloA/Tae2 family protein